MIQIDPEIAAMLPPLSTAEKQVLEQDIQKNGVLMPIVVDEDGTILDGHHRYAIDPSAPTVVVSGLTREEKLAYTIKSNLARRNLSLQQKSDVEKKQREIAVKLLGTGWTQKRVGESLGVTQGAVSQWLDANNISANITCVPDARVKIGADHHPVIVERLEQGETQEQVAADYQVTRQQIANIAKKQKKERELNAKRDVDYINPNLTFECGDFEAVFADIPDGSIDLILTDPPYPAEFIDCWTKLARFASKKLKKNGYCVAYSGQLNLPEVYRRMTEYLDYVWTCSLVHAGTHQLIQPRNVMCGWKPILIYQNGFKKMPGKSFSDIVQGTGLEKDAHRWQQAEDELIGLIDYFSNPGETILEPFAGGGTTIVASLKRGRNVLAAEIDKNSYNRAQKRLAGTEGL
jgi:site-specific DNA-methyltransferase (adenine-specific)